MTNPDILLLPLGYQWIYVGMIRPETGSKTPRRVWLALCCRTRALMVRQKLQLLAAAFPAKLLGSNQ